MRSIHIRMHCKHALARIIHEQRPHITRHFGSLIEQRSAQLHRSLSRHLSWECPPQVRFLDGGYPRRAVEPIRLRSFALRG